MSQLRRTVLDLLIIGITISTLAACVSGPRFDSEEIEPAIRVEERSQHILLEPITGDRATGLIFYPGGLVAPEAYIPLLDSLAAAGYTVLIPSMPFGLAVFAPMRGVPLREEYPQITRWIIGGHSLGGAMAARAVYRDPNAFEGLVLVASYPANNDDLSNRRLPVVSIFGEVDGLATAPEIESSVDLLPDNTVFVEIAGGNHAQFGSYGPQDGDNDATISRELQQRLAARAILQLLESFAAN